jgi:hypothetical protein
VAPTNGGAEPWRQQNMYGGRAGGGGYGGGGGGYGGGDYGERSVHARRFDERVLTRATAVASSVKSRLSRYGRPRQKLLLAPCTLQSRALFFAPHTERTAARRNENRSTSQNAAARRRPTRLMTRRRSVAGGSGVRRRRSAARRRTGTARTITTGRAGARIGTALRRTTATMTAGGTRATMSVATRGAPLHGTARRPRRPGRRHHHAVRARTKPTGWRRRRS